MRVGGAIAAALLAMPAAVQGQAMPGMAMPGAPPAAGDAAAAPPPVPAEAYADRTYGSQAMAAARARMMREQGGTAFHQLLFNLAEVQVRDGRAGYRWDGEGWFGGDINRVVVMSEGSGGFGAGVDEAEVQLLYSRAIAPYVDLQAGIRHDVAPTPTRTYASIGVEALAPYRFQVELRGFVATTGQVLGRVEGWYDQRLTQRLVLQPRVELNLSAQNDAATRTGAGLAEAELGLRLRYGLIRELAPYVGLAYVARTGQSARYARDDGHAAQGVRAVFGTRFWF